MVGGNALATSISGLALILVSRLLGPSKFGDFSIGFALILVLIRLNDFGLNAALQKFLPSTKSEDAKNKIISYVTFLKIVANCVMTVIAFILTPLLSNYLHLTSPLILQLAVLLALATVSYEHVIAILQSLHLFSQVVMMNFIQATTKLLGFIAFWLIGMNNVNAVFGWYGIAPLFSALIGWRFLPKWIHITIHNTFSTEHTLIKNMALHSAVGFVAAGVIDNVDIFFVQRYLSSYETGLLGGLSRISMLLLLVAYSLANVLNPRVARYKQKTDLFNYYKKALVVALVCFFGMIAFIPFAKPLIWLTIGPDYVDGTSYLLILMAASFITVAAIPFQALFYSFKADWYFSVSGIMQLVIVVLGNMFFVPLFGLAAAAWIRLATRLFLLVFSFVVSFTILYLNHAKSNNNSS